MIPWPCLWSVGSFLCRTPWGRRCINWRDPNLKRELNVSRTLFAALGLAPDHVDRGTTRVYQNGVFQTILLARLATLSPREEERQFEVHGFEHLSGELEARRPVIVGGTHFGVNRVFPLWLTRRGVEVLSLESRDQLATMGMSKPAALQVVEVGTGFKAQATVQALRQLQAGGCLHLTGDRRQEQDDKSSVRRTFHGITRQYPQGLANLSLMGGAAILPYFCTLQPGGRVRIEIHPPIRPPVPPAPAGSSERKAQIEDLVHRFAAVLEGEIEQTPGNQRWM